MTEERESVCACVNVVEHFPEREANNRESREMERAVSAKETKREGKREKKKNRKNEEKNHTREMNKIKIKAAGLSVRRSFRF